jgi:HD-GYP domain-containing protein (c-di-GMP phosphodiesterase class II)
MAATRTDDKQRVAREAYLQLAAAADEFEQYSHPHAARVAAIADRIAEAFHLAPQDRRYLRRAAYMHDLGEVAMERDYIQSRGPLAPDERADLARHPVIGEQEAARASADRAVQLLVRWHHEWWNGSGYPDALSKTEIPLAARILRVADSYAALTDARPYRAAKTEEEARSMMIEGAGIEFDPEIISVFLALERFDELRSYAQQGEPVAPAFEEKSTLFSSFMK